MLTLTYFSVVLFNIWANAKPSHVEPTLIRAYLFQETERAVKQCRSTWRSNTSAGALPLQFSFHCQRKLFSSIVYYFAGLHGTLFGK